MYCQVLSDSRELIKLFVAMRAFMYYIYLMCLLSMHKLIILYISIQ